MTALRILSPRSLLGLFLVPLGLMASTAQAQSLGVCNSFYTSGFTLAEGKVNPSMPALAKPAKGHEGVRQNAQDTRKILGKVDVLRTRQILPVIAGSLGRKIDAHEIIKLNTLR